MYTIIFILYWLGTLFNVFTNKYVIPPKDSDDSIIFKEIARVLFIIFSWFSWIVWGIVILTNERYDTRR